jgi:hypothetical protein
MLRKKKLKYKNSELRGVYGICIHLQIYFKKL